MLDFGANIHLKNVGGNTPLHVAASRNSKESTKWLLLRNADTEIVNKSGKKPFDVAIQASSIEVSDIIAKFRPEQVVLSPPRYFPESITEYEGIVQNMLSSLSSSIGREYTPSLYYVKPPTAGKTASYLKKSLSVVLTEDDGMSRTSLEERKSLESQRQSSIKVGSGPGSLERTGSRSIVTESALSLAILPEQQGISGSRSIILENSVTDIVDNTRFETAWKKISVNKPPGLNTLKHYLVEKIVESPVRKAEVASPFDEMLSDLEDIERGIVKAVDEWEDLRKENAQLLKRLQELESQ